MLNKLYKHNQDSYKKVKEAFESGQDTVGIVHATGTGKSFNALALAHENKDKKFIYVVPGISIVEHIKEIIENTLGMSMEKDFPNLEFRTYQALASLYKNDREELGKNRLCNLEVDYLVLDEFHHLGAPVWGPAVEEIINTHEDLKIFGMSAYTVRHRGTAFERDMAEDNGDELFSDKIVSRYDLVDAIMDGILPQPIYKTGYIHLKEMADDIEKRLKTAKLSDDEKNKCLSSLKSAKKKMHECDNVSTILKNNLKKNGKYIYFCPVKSIEDENDINTIMSEIKNELLEFLDEDDFVLYKTTSKDRISGKSNREAFYNDADVLGEDAKGKLQIMFAINQYNEGVHAPNIDGVILGRGTSSDIVYFEQIGRALSVESNSVPTIIDLQNNIEFIRELENNLRDRVREELEKTNPTRTIVYKTLDDVSFDITLDNIDLYNELLNLREKISMTWNDYYELLETYYNENNHSNVPLKFKTIDGKTETEDKNGINLGVWVRTQRTNKENLSEKQQELLKAVNFIYDVLETQWQEKYNLLKKYYEENNDSNVSTKFKTFDGVTKTEDKNGINLGAWVQHQRANKENLSEKQQELLKAVNFIYDVFEIQWQEKYNLLKKYYEANNDSNVSQRFKTFDGVTKTEDKNGINLGRWVRKQRLNKENLSEEHQELLKEVNFIFSIKNNELELLMLCKEYEINYKKHKKILEKSSCDFIKMKILFLIDNNLSIEENGILRDIFSMSNENMMATYNISIEELYNKYISNQKVN